MLRWRVVKSPRNPDCRDSLCKPGRLISYIFFPYFCLFFRRVFVLFFPFRMQRIFFVILDCFFVFSSPGSMSLSDKLCCRRWLTPQVISRRAHRPEPGSSLSHTIPPTRPSSLPLSLFYAWQSTACTMLRPSHFFFFSFFAKITTRQAWAPGFHDVRVSRKV